MSFDGELLVIKTLQATTVDEFVTVLGVLPIEPHPIPKRFAVVGHTIRKKGGTSALG